MPRSARVGNVFPSIRLIPATGGFEYLRIDANNSMAPYLDDFLGDSLDSRWNVEGAGTATLVTGPNGIINMDTGAVLNQYVALKWGTVTGWRRGQFARLEARLRLVTTTLVSVSVGFAQAVIAAPDGMPAAGLDFLGLTFRPPGDVNWVSRISNGGVSSIDTGIAPSGFMKLGIEMLDTVGRTYINDILVATHVLAWGTTVLLEPYIGIESNEALTAKNMRLDWVRAWAPERVTL